MQRDSFVRYESFSSAINILPEANQSNAYKFIIEYWLRGIEPDSAVDPIAYAIFIMAKPQIDANNKRFINWQKGWRPKVERENSKKPNSNQKWTKQKPNVNVNVNVNDNVNENVNANVNDNVNEKTKKINKKVVYSDDFETFRKAYPKKKGKQMAWKAWESTIKWGYDPKLLITKAWEYATEIKLKRVEDHYIKLAQWWLNDWRFDDDYFTWNSGEKPDLDVLY